MSLFKIRIIIAFPKKNVTENVSASNADDVVWSRKLRPQSNELKDLC